MDTDAPTTSLTETLRGEAERLVFTGDETGYTVCRVRVPGHHDLVTAVGSMPGIQPGERLSSKASSTANSYVGTNTIRKN